MPFLADAVHGANACIPYTCLLMPSTCRCMRAGASFHRVGMLLASRATCTGEECGGRGAQTLRAFRSTGRIKTREELPVTAKTVQRTRASRHHAPEKRGTGISPPARVVQAQNFFFHGPRAWSPPAPAQKLRRNDTSLLLLWYTRDAAFAHTLPPPAARAAHALAACDICDIASLRILQVLSIPL